jgi:hypothetical protein
MYFSLTSAEGKHTVPMAGAWRGRFRRGHAGYALDRLSHKLRLLSGVFLPATDVTAGYIS